MSQSLTKQNQEDYYNISDLLNKNCMDYAKYVLTSRAIPDLRDGCKPIHRRIIWSFYKNKLTYDKNRVKSANAIGGVLSYSPHGDASVYEACVRLANDSVNLNLIDGKGSFSSTTSRDVQAGASRYTEMRLSKVSSELLKGIDNDIVDMVLNYDETKYEPEVLPASFPLILCNPNMGIGVGLSSNVCSFNMNEVCNYTIDMLNEKEPDMIIPDFPTGGLLVYDRNIINSINTSGIGSVKMRAKYHIDDTSIVITEIPYTTTREAIVEKVIDLVKHGKIKEITDINDYTGIDGLNITIDVKKNTNCKNLMDRLFKMTSLQDTFSCNFNVISNGRPQLLGVKSIIGEWIKFRKQCLKRELQYDINSLQEKKTRLDGLKIILNDLDKAISIIRGSRSEKEAMEQLKSYFSLNQAQVDYICTIKLVNMNNEWLTNKTNELTTINQQLLVNQQNLSDDNYYNQTIINQLNYVKKTYGKPRKTTILYDVDTTQVQEIIVDEGCAVVLTRDGYVKRTSRYSATQKVKEGDEILLNQACTTKHTLLIFTNTGTCYKLFLHELEATLPSNLGNYIYSLLDIPRDEIIVAAQVVRGYKGYLINVYQNNKLSKIHMSSFQTQQKRSSLKNAISTDSKLITQYTIEEDVDIIVRSSIDKVVICNTSDFSAKNSKNSQGDALIKSKNDSVVVECHLLSDIDTTKLDVEYYKSKRGATGSYLKKVDEITLKNN